MVSDDDIVIKFLRDTWPQMKDALACEGGDLIIILIK